MKLNKKRFTLIELLVTIVIIALVIVFSTFCIINVVNNSKNKATVLSTDSLKKAANVYSTEASSDSWKRTNSDYDAFCVTVGELMNKGLLDKDGIISDDSITRETFIIVKRNNITLVTEKTEIVVSDDENYKICTNTSSYEGKTVSKPVIGSSINYTDKLEISYTSGSATYQDNNVEVSYNCLYGESSSSINREGIVENNKCILSGLKNNKDYYVMIYMNTNNGSSVIAEGDINYKTNDFNNTTFSQNKNIVNVKYNNKDTNGNNVNNPSYYFKSTVEGTTTVNVQECTLNNNIFSCSVSTNIIKKRYLV